MGSEKCLGVPTPKYGVPTLPPTLPKGGEKISLYFRMIESKFKKKKKIKKKIREKEPKSEGPPSPLGKIP